MAFFKEERGQFMMYQRDRIMELEQVDSVVKLSLPEISKYLNNKFQVKMSIYAWQLLMH